MLIIKPLLTLKVLSCTCLDYSEVSDEEIMSTSTSRGSTAVAHRSSHVSHFSRASLKSHAVIRRPAPVVRSVDKVVHGFET